MLMYRNNNIVGRRYCKQRIGKYELQPRCQDGDARTSLKA